MINYDCDKIIDEEFEGYSDNDIYNYFSCDKCGDVNWEEQQGHILCATCCAYYDNEDEDEITMLESEIIDLQDDYNRLREAGFELAEAALYVAKNYDGVHRLLLAASNFTFVVANEGSRDCTDDEEEFEEEN
jgi:uncharacterized Zn finger protein (UPF0148 family)